MPSFPSSRCEAQSPHAKPFLHNPFRPKRRSFSTPTMAFSTPYDDPRKLFPRPPFSYPPAPPPPPATRRFLSRHPSISLPPPIHIYNKAWWLLSPPLFPRIPAAIPPHLRHRSPASPPPFPLISAVRRPHSPQLPAFSAPFFALRDNGFRPAGQGRKAGRPKE